MNRRQIAVALLVGVIGWVLLLSIFSTSPSSANSKSIAAKDGSRCVIKFVDKSRFSDRSNPGRVVLRMDVVDGAGTPLVGLRAHDFEVTEEDFLGRIGEFQGPQSQAINLILVIDISGSMNRERRIDGVRESALAVLDALKLDRDRLAIIPFSDKFHVLRPLDVLSSTNLEHCRSLIRSLSAAGGTSIGPPTLEALQLYASEPVDGAKMIMIMTDGDDPPFHRYLDQIVTKSEDAGVQIHTVGFGNEVGESAKSVLEEIARRCAGTYQHAPTNEELTKIFHQRVQETINQSTLTYDSPYPQPDGLPRQAEVQIKSKHGDLTSNFTYEIGPILGGRGTPAPWAVRKGSLAPEKRGILAAIFPFVLFVILLCLLLTGLILPEIRPAEFNAALANVPVSNSPPPIPATSGQTIAPRVSLPPPPSKMAPPTPSKMPPPPVPSTPAVPTATSAPAQPKPVAKAISLPPPPGRKG